MSKKPIRLTESDLKQIVKDSVGNILKETRKKDPMRQWFKDMEDIQKHRDNMEYITKGGRKPKHWNESDLHRIVKESVNRILNESFCSSGNKEYDYLSNSLFSLIEDWGISEQMNQNKTFQEGRKMLHQALKTLEVGFREYNNYEDTGSYDGGEGFSDYSGGSLY